MERDDFLQLVEDIHDAEILIAHLRKQKEDRQRPPAWVAQHVRPLEAEVSRMRALKSRHERLELAHVMGAHEAWPKYDGAGITAPVGERVRLLAAEIGAEL